MFNEPASLFVAAFIGTPSMNLLPVRFAEGPGAGLLRGDGIALPAPQWLRSRPGDANQALTVGIRPQMQWKLVNSLWGLVLLYVAVNLPFTVWLLYGFVLQVPLKWEEAAAIDGCGPVKVFTKILLPLMAPGLAAASIFTFRIAWNEFILALVLTDRSTRTLPVAASLFITDIGVDWGKVMAMGSLIAVPPLIFTFVAARQIITGLTASAVKG